MLDEYLIGFSAIGRLTNPKNQSILIVFTFVP
jgi:hypothetical protein